MNDRRLRQISMLTHINIFRERNDKLYSFQSTDRKNPIAESKNLRQILRTGASKQTVPFIYEDSFHIHFSAFFVDEDLYLMGPMALQEMNISELHRFCQTYELPENETRRFILFTPNEILSGICLVAELFSGFPYSNQELLEENSLIIETGDAAVESRIKFNITAGEDALSHHTYKEELALLSCVREGQVEDALRMNAELDSITGRLSGKDLSHWKNLAIVGITLCTRAAIEGGISPSVGYKLSDYYIQKCDTASDAGKVIQYRNQAISELTERVKNRNKRLTASHYVEAAIEYVNRHYRDKLYLEDVANKIGISPTYLSRLFKKDKGIRFQDYINQVRVDHAANLLRYSSESLSHIADYVHFPSQSYFGKIFKKEKGMTPAEYRNRYKNQDF